MIFFPYKVDLDLRRIPLVTLLVCALCIAVFYQQFSRDIAIHKSATSYCKQGHERTFLLVVEKITGGRGVKQCVQTLMTLHNSTHPQQIISELADKAAKFDGLTVERGQSLINDVLNDKYADFSQQTPPSLTAQLVYEPRSFDVIHMITAVFSHGSLLHLVGNLFFFYAFAASVEIILGSMIFTLLIFVFAIATNTAYSMAVLTDPVVMPTLGLSGVVMGMIALFTFLIPMARIRCFFWFFFFVRIFVIPGWFLALWYIGLDVFHLYNGGGQPNVNIVAHVSGAATGLLLGVLFFRHRRPILRSSGRIRRV
jgi:membrane associated rhomboid family serine protease